MVRLDATSVSRNDGKSLAGRLSALLLVVVVGTVLFAANAIPVLDGVSGRPFAGLRFVGGRVVLLLFPAMAVRAEVLTRTSVLVVLNEVRHMPVLAFFCRVIEEMGFSSEILPIMSIYTLAPRMNMLLVRVGAPDGLEVEDIKVIVFLHLIEEVNPQLVLAVGKRAEGPILTVRKF